MFWNWIKSLWNSPQRFEYKPGDFILTKSYINSKGRVKGDLVLRVEHVVKDNLLCSKGRFEIVYATGIYTKSNKLEYVFDNGQKLTNISKSNVQKKLSQEVAYKLLNERVARIK